MLNYYFAGALTPKGFISYFEDIPDGKEDKLIIIKKVDFKDKIIST